nr:hypothetical protein [Tanacetum cinerariifolium]
RARIAQSSALPTAADEPASTLGDDSQDLCTRLQRQQTEMASKIVVQDLEITSLKARIKLLEDKDGGGVKPSGKDATIKGRNLETGEEACVERSTERGSNDTKEMVNVLTSLDAASILTSRDQMVGVPPAAEVATISVPTGSGLVPTASPIFTTASVVTPCSRRKCKEKIIESDTPKKKKLQEQIDIHVAREMEEQMVREDQRRSEQIVKDAEMARIHAEEELQMMINGLDRNNEMIAKHLHEYEQAAAELTIGEKIELINELVKYQDHHSKILKYKAQQSKPLSKKQQREFYISRIKDFVPMASKEEGERFKRKGLRLEHDSAKKIKTSEEVSEEDLKAMMQLVPVEEVYVEALQVKHLIIHTKGQRNYWKIIRLGGSTTVYEFFVDMLRHFDREDLNQLWTLVKETLSIRQATSIPTASDKFPLPDYFPTASEDRFPLLSEKDAPNEEVCTVDEVKVVDPIFGNNSRLEIVDIEKVAVRSSLRSPNNKMMMEILLEPTSSKLLVGDVGDSLWIELVKLDINLGPE